MAIYSSDDTQLIPTGQSVTLDQWDANRKEPKGDILSKVSRVWVEVDKVRKLLEVQEEDVTPFNIKAAYIRKLNQHQGDKQVRDKVRKQEAKGVSSLAEDWTISQLFKYRRSTQKTVTESINAFTEYLKKGGQGGLDRKGLTQEVVTRYERYLQEKKMLSNSTHGKRMKHLRWFLKYIDFDTSKIKLRTFTKQIICLDVKELEALEAVEVYTTDEIRAKDMFLLGCYTGQRISDLKRITAHSIIDNEIRIRQTKTGKDVFIPLSPQSKAILDRHNGAAPRITEQDLNKTIKTVCKNAKIDTVMSIVSNKGGIDLKRNVDKSSLITSHVASKTFISTVGPERYNLTPPEIAAICGKNLKTLLTHYFNLPRESAKQKMLSVHGSQNS